MGCRIIGEQEQGTVSSIQGDVTLTILPDATLAYIPASGSLEDPPGYQNFLQFVQVTGADAANQTIAKSDTQYGQQYDGVACQRFMRLHTGTAQPYRDAEVVIRNGYVTNYIVGNDYKPAGYLQYPIGLHHNYVEWGHAGSLDAVEGWLDGINWSWADSDDRRHHVFSREIAYSLLSLVMYEKMVGVGNGNLTAVGKDIADRYATLIPYMENHIYQWRFRDFSDPFFESHPYIDARADFMNPFMVAITCYCLQRYYDHNLAVRGNGNLNWPTINFTDIPTAVNSMLTWMMDFADIKDGDQAGERIYKEGPDHGLPDGAGAFVYIDCEASGIGGPSVAVDLNMLIAPVYGWLGKHYGQSHWFTGRADPLFYGGTSNLHDVRPAIHSGLDMKRLNQQLVWMDDYFTWRGQV